MPNPFDKNTFPRYYENIKISVYTFFKSSILNCEKIISNKLQEFLNDNHHREINLLKLHEKINEFQKKFRKLKDSLSEFF